jgi:hypothetical protein
MRYEYKYVTPFNFYFNKTQIEKGFEEEKSTVLREFERKQMEDPSGLFNSKIRKTYQNKLGE